MWEGTPVESAAIAAAGEVAGDENKGWMGEGENITGKGGAEACVAENRGRTVGPNSTGADNRQPQQVAPRRLHGPLVWEDDSQIVGLTLRKAYDPRASRIELEIAQSLQVSAVS